MLKIYKTSKSEIIKSKNIHKDCWIDLTMPTEEEIDRVVKATKIDKDLIIKMLDEEERPRIEISNNDTLIVIDIPFLELNNGTYEFITYPLGIIISKNNYLITVSLKKLKLLNDFKHNRIKDFKPGKKTRFLIQILLKTASMYQKALKGINKNIENKEEVLKKSTKNKDLIDLLETEKTLVYFITSLKANDLVLEKLNKGVVLKLFEEDYDLLEDAIIENKQAIEMSEIYRNILSSITDTYATIVSNNMNNAMKFLAGMTIILSVPTIISSFLGMNIPFPHLAHLNSAYIILLIVSIVISILTAIILKIKDML